MPEIVRKMVGDPGIEPGTSRLGGVTVRCRTLQPVTRRCAEYPRGMGASRADRAKARKSFGLRLPPAPPHSPSPKRKEFGHDKWNQETDMGD